MNIFNPQELDLKLDPQHQEDYDPQRMKNIIDFMGSPKEPVLDIGPRNRFGVELSEKLGLLIVNTDGDLDTLQWKPEKDISFDTVWIFEMIEHLKNPDLFLRMLKRNIHGNTKIYLMYPNRTFRMFWSHNHWHEIDPIRFRLLVEEAGYKIIRHKHKILHRKWTFYLSGIRPILRFIFAPYHHHYYELRLK